MAVDDRLAATLREALRLRQEARDLRGGVDGGGSGGASSGKGDDPLKARVDFLQTAFLWLAGALVTTVIGIVAIAVTMTNATNTRLDRTADGISSLNREVGQISVSVDQANRQLEKIDQKLGQGDPRVGKK